MQENLDLTRGLQILKEAAENIPNSYGIYKMLADNQEILYIGKAKDLPQRIKQYTNVVKMPNRLRLLVALVAKVEFLVTASEAEALLLEAELIKAIQPKFNIALKDGKSFPYIAIDERHTFPRIFKFRGEKKNNISYFGPFADAKQLEKNIIESEKIFKVRSCTDNYFKARTKPCLLYQISRCSAPCVLKIDERSYREHIQQVKLFLSGESKHIQSQLLKEMEEASSALEFEKAAKIRDTIALLNKNSEGIFANISRSDIDIFAYSSNGEQGCIQVFLLRNNKNYGNNSFYLDNTSSQDNNDLLMLFCIDFYKMNHIPQEIWIDLGKTEISILKEALQKLSGEKVNIINPRNNNLMEFAIQNAEKSLNIHIRKSLKNKKLLEDLKEKLKLRNIPKRIEVYDNSHIQGEHAVGCMIVAGPEGFVKNQYRKFTIRERNHPQGGDDYGMMREVITRRIAKFLEDPPNLLLIDGGKGQLATVLEVLNDHKIKDIEVIAIAKGEDRNSGRETFYTSNKEEIQLAHNDTTRYYLQNLRDEAHRFAITTYRRLHRKKIIESKITDIPGIGKKRQKVLLAVFGSYQNLLQATNQELQQIKYIGKNMAIKIYSYLHGSKHI